MIRGKKRDSEAEAEEPITEEPSKKSKLIESKPDDTEDNQQDSNQDTPETPYWHKFKKDKKEQRLKRKQANKFYDVCVEANNIFEVLRQKRLRGTVEQRNTLISKLHNLFVEKGQYCKVVFAHDIARIVQFLFKFSDENIKNDIAKELIPVTVGMLESKYGRNCLKSMLKYGNDDIRSASIKKMYGKAVKFTTHLISASTFEYAYSTWATPQQKQDLVQEFFGEMYKKVKDAHVKHLRDVYKDSPSMKTAALRATKVNILKVLNKELLDSGLVQTVLHQFISECNAEDRSELISQLAPHVVVISNSKNGAKAAMQCIWYGTNKERKIIMKAIKEHVKDLSKHEHGHCTVIALLDAVDDTVLVNKMILTQLISDVNELVADEHGRKVLLWLVAPGNPAYFHQSFIKELEAGREVSCSKKSVDHRRQELLNYVIFMLANEIIAKTEFWMSTGSIAMLTLAIVKSAPDEFLGDALKAIAKTITNVDWTIANGEKQCLAMEDPGLHMMLKKLAQHDKVLSTADKPTFGSALLSEISDETVKKWLELNRGCFLFVVVYENGTESIQQQLKEKLESHLTQLQKQTTSGAKILLKKLTN